MIDNLNYVQANEALNGENGQPGEVDVLNRPIKELVELFNSGNADTQVRRINFKIIGHQEITDGIVSDDVVSYDYTTQKYVKSIYNDKKSLGIIDVENLMIYSFGEYTLKNRNDLIPGKSYWISQETPGEIVDVDDVAASSTHIGIAINSNTIEINKFVDATFASVVIDDITPTTSTVYSSAKVESLLRQATGTYFFLNANQVNAINGNTSLLNIPINSPIIDLNLQRLYVKVSNAGLTATSTLINGVNSTVVLPITIHWNNVTDKPNFHIVATSGNYNDLINKPGLATSTVPGLMSPEDKQNLINMMNGGVTPTGTIITFSANTPPNGYLACNGQQVSRTTYANLFSIIGTTYGAGNGTTTFNLPDLRGYFVRGWDNGRNIDSGRVFGSNQNDENKSHSHTGSTNSSGDHTHTFSVNALDGIKMGGWSGSFLEGYAQTSSAGAHTHTLSINNNGGVESRPKNIALLYCIKF